MKYVGDAACVGCHQAITESYHKHPMGRSASAVKPGEGPEKIGPSSKLPVTAPGYKLDVATAGGRVEHVVTATGSGAESLSPYRATIDVAIGSGSRGRSYLTCQDGAVWQSPLSWFGQDGRWDVSPGFRVAQSARRPVLAECLFCHVNRVEPVTGAINRYSEPLLREQPAIGCERCHGPGELHVRERAETSQHPKPDLSIVNPKHLSADLAQDVCRQCHLQGASRQPADGRGAFDFRPGLPLDDFVRVFVFHPDIAEAGHSVAQFEQVETSKCHAGSGGRLRCTTCHDPHLNPAEADKPAFYRAKCQTCHIPPAGKDCNAPAAVRATKADNCMACHMPRGDSRDIAHVAVTDHRILRRPTKSLAKPPTGLPVQSAVVPYRQRTGPEADRDLGLALRWATAKLDDRQARQATLQAFDLLGRAADTRPNDTAVAVRLSWMLKPFNQPADRLGAARQAARAAPEDEFSLDALTDAYLDAGLITQARETATRLVALSPTNVEYRMYLVTALIRDGDWPAAAVECQAVLRLQPLHATARLYLAGALFKAGKRDLADREESAAAALFADPAALADRRRWLAGQLR